MQVETQVVVGQAIPGLLMVHVGEDHQVGVPENVQVAARLLEVQDEVAQAREQLSHRLAGRRRARRSATGRG